MSIWSDYDGESVARRLRELREAQGWTMREAARRSGVAVQTISQAEQGREITFRILGLLAAAYRVPSQAIIAPRSAPPPMREALDAGLLPDATKEELARLEGAEEILGRPCDAWDYQALLALMRKRATWPGR